jgi:hypothetical protein
MRFKKMVQLKNYIFLVCYLSISCTPYYLKGSLTMKYTTLTCALFCALFSLSTTPNSTITGKVKFSSRPFAIPIYCAGRKAATELDPQQLFFTVPKMHDQRTFWVIITEPIINYETIDPHLSNTIDYLKIPQGQRYRLYKITASPDATWTTEEKVLDETMRIPDHAVIICCNPDFIAGIESSTGHDLPAIKIRDDLVSFMGSEAELHDAINGIALASIDIDTLHAKAHQERHIKISHNKVLIAPPIS